MNRRGFTLIEMLVVLAIISILLTVVITSVSGARLRAQEKRARLELRSIETAMHLWALEHGGNFPDDVSRSLPPGLEMYLHNPADAGAWPNAPFKGSVYDWDAWTDPDTGEPIYQISIRFCPAGGPLSACHFPDFSWATGFGVNSAFYWCVSGPCRAHIAEPVDYPGYCINC